MARKSKKDLVDTPETPRGNESAEIESREVDGGTPELAHASDAIAAGIFRPEDPVSIKGDATPDKRG